MTPEAAGALASLAGLLIMLGVGIRAYRIEKRKLREETDQMLRAGMRSAWRRGYLRDGDQ